MKLKADAFDKTVDMPALAYSTAKTETQHEA